MRTTLDLEPGLLAQLKEQAARERTTVSQLANQLIRMAISAQQNEPDQVPFPMACGKKWQTCRWF
ncbi:hypothetical protein [Endozoicomonas acroporae]|uniref:hypothetical protein n=1 Tax=Endozoicomonas acroporae TaxID=1701104 RepID=UPI0013D2F833|nr:hypothetical protein [Endozoicomonas acroporae]